MLNHIVIHGRLTRDPEVRTTQSGVNVASFTVAVDRDYSDQGGNRETDFIDCVAWRQGADFVSRYFSKGQLILVEGRLTSRKWTDRDGNKRVTWEIVAEHTYFGEPKRDAGQQSRYGGDYGAPPPGNSYASPPPSNQAPPASNYGAPPSRPAYPPQQNQQSTFTDLGDDDGDLPF